MSMEWTSATELPEDDWPRQPDSSVSVREIFGFEVDWAVPAFATRTALVPERMATYAFDRETTLAVLAGFAFERRVLLQGYHGTGKSSHIEQIAARLNWPCLRVNLDGFVTRTDLLGRDAIVVRDGRQITAFQEGLLTWAVQHPCVLVLDEYDAARPEVLFVIQRLLEAQGRLTVLEQNRVLTPHPAFRLMATANTVGLGDATGLYRGTHALNQGQMDRWSVVATLNYLPPESELRIVLANAPAYRSAEGRELAACMVQMAGLTRAGFRAGDLSTVMSPRTVIVWAQNAELFGDVATAFRLSFLNKCDPVERLTVAEYYQRCFGEELPLPDTLEDDGSA